MSSASYAFGDSAAARERLELLGKIFDPPSRAFLLNATDSPPGLAVDLGCGPGGSTAMVHAATKAQRTVGLDLSAAFVAAATGRSAAGVEFLRHDITETPFPVGPADFLYARLLVAHLTTPEATVIRWLTQLVPEGRLALDEVEWIPTDEPVLDEYLGIATALIAEQGGDMYAGPRLAAMPLAGAAVMRLSEVAVVAAPVGLAARMFGLNLGVWGASRWIVERYGTHTIDRLAETLGALSSSPRLDGITWGMRHLLLERLSDLAKPPDG